jgi:hypothetical protein
MVVSATLLLYDHAISLGEEVRSTDLFPSYHVILTCRKIDHMWTIRWSLSQLLYLTVSDLPIPTEMH